LVLVWGNSLRIGGGNHAVLPSPKNGGGFLLVWGGGVGGPPLGLGGVFGGWGGFLKGW